MMGASMDSGPRSLSLDTLSDGGAWPEGTAERGEAIAGAIAACVDQDRIQGVASVMMSSDANVRALNARFRDQDAPTNVLSFPAPRDVDLPGEPVYLGDVILARETVMREAEEQSKSASAHTIHLIVHGILHLLGYDHETDEGAAEMEALEVRILDHLDVSDPYKEELLGSR